MFLTWILILQSKIKFWGSQKVIFWGYPILMKLALTLKVKGAGIVIPLNG